MTKQHFFFGIACVFPLVLLGCGAGGEIERPETVAVSGSVLYKGKPVEGAQVSFMTSGAPRPASGVTDAEGKFELSTFEPKDGAIIGTHVITISKAAPGSGAAASSAAPSDDPSAMLGDYTAAADSDFQDSKALLPTKYASAGTSPLQEEVKKGAPNSFVFELVD